MIELGAVALRREEDIVRAHQTTRTVAAQLGFSTFEQTRIATAMSEIARNALVYASGGTVALSLAPDTHALRVEVIDRGSGISDVPGALRGAGRGPGAAGIGIPGARRLMDGLTIDSTRAGTRVVMVKRLPRRAWTIPDAQLTRLREVVAEHLVGDAHQEVRRLQRDLAERDQQIAELMNEIKDTNRGVMALYAELEARAEYQRAAAELRTRLVSEMGHELRTPLHSIFSVAEFLVNRLDGDLTPEQDRQARLILSISSDMLAYVNDLVELARADAGKLAVHTAPVAIDALLGTLRRMMAPLAKTPGVALEFSSRPSAHELVTDESKVSQILRNLVANALKFTERGSVAVTAYPSGDRVIFEVADTGVGIAPEHLDLIFEEFAMVEGPHQHRVRGTGLGLPLSRRLAEVLGGTLTVTSELGAGSTFRLDLPATLPGQPAPPPGVPEAPVTAVPAPGKSRILVIDDDEASRYVLRRWLEDRFVIVEATSGRDGLAQAIASPPDAIFLDVVMPDLTGFEVLERLEEDPATAAIPVVIYTALVLGADDRTRLGRAVAIVRKSTASRAADRSSLEQALVAARLATLSGAS
jgi:signal transduction histidine kinase/ActR/RegA family two-component response regulator